MNKRVSSSHSFLDLCVGTRLYNQVLLGNVCSVRNNYILSINFQWFLDNYGLTYGEINDATYEVIMRKSRASLEPFWDLKISK